MLLILLTGFAVMLVCLLFQAAFVALCLRRYLAIIKAGRADGTWWFNVRLLSMVLLLLIFGNFVQMALWATLFVLLGEFSDFDTALYFSAVTYASLGYGDIVMAPPWRLLGPLEAANGVMMFGVSTAVVTAAVMDIVKYGRARIKQGD